MCLVDHADYTASSRQREQFHTDEITTKTTPICPGGNPIPNPNLSNPNPVIPTEHHHVGIITQHLSEVRYLAKCVTMV